MADLSMKEFMTDVDGKKKSDIMDWKSKGKIQIFLHPESGIRRRNSHWISAYVEREVEETKGKGKDKKKVKVKKMVVVPYMINCPNTKEHPNNCFVCNLRKYLRDNEDIDNDEIILEVGEGDDMVQYSKGDIIGEEGFDWKKNMSYRKEYLFGVVDAEEAAKTEVLIAPLSLGKEIKKVIQNEIEDEGEEEGDPFKNPYPIKITYDEDEVPAKMYAAIKGKAKLTDDIEELLEESGVDLDQLAEPTKPSDIVKLLKDCIVSEDVDIDEILPPGFDEDDDEDEKPSKSKGKGKKEEKKPTKGKKKVEDEDEDDEDDEDKKPSKSKGKGKNEEKKPVRGKKKEEPKEEEDDDESGEEDDIEEKEKKPAKGKKGKPEAPKKGTSEKDKKPKKSSESKDEDDEDDEDEEEVKPKKGKGKKEEKKPAKGKGKKKKVECPECGEEIDEDADECPECGAEFESDDEEMIECPECGKKVSVTEEECSHCGEDIIPF